jgi:glycosyltransferase involved in cell wall biosynthesis
VNVPLPAPISVVIPAHNAEEFIQQAIESVHDQTLPVAEVIVVADACSDDTCAIAKRLGAIVFEGNFRNISAATNLGVRAAGQEWIALLDADDFWEKRKIEAQWKAVQAFPDAAIISCDLYTVFEGRIKKRSRKLLSERHGNLSSPAIVTKQGTYFPRVDGSVLRWFQVAPPAALLRRDVFPTVGFFDEHFLHCQDVEFFARALRFYPLVVIEEPLVCQRVHNNSHSTNAKESWNAALSVVDRMLRHPNEYPPGAGREYREHLKQMFVSYERLLARGTPTSRSFDKNQVVDAQPRNPNQP